jgi:hypothetical protein
MSKRLTTRWYIGAWIVAVIATIFMVTLMRGSGGEVTYGVVVARLVAFVAGLVMFVMWLGALIKLGQQHAWGWFAFVLLVYLLTLGVLGIVAMVVYAIAGPEDTEVVMRPTVT